jgi:hypothetical protein
MTGAAGSGIRVAVVVVRGGGDRRIVLVFAVDEDGFFRPAPEQDDQFGRLPRFLHVCITSSALLLAYSF